ncbi:MAG: dienelactone hydrolase family protein [Myxococcota bacterium]|nr:dienelactone hydrolase family protein [Myxococcota bacterium]
MRCVAALLVLITGCGGSLPLEQPAPPPVAPPELLAGTDAARATMSPAAPGALSEAEFKALHVLAEGTVPALLGEMVPLSDGSSAYRSAPPGATAATPAVLVVHEWWGLNDHIKHYADRLAGDGYVALAVDLYGGVVAADADAAMARMKSVDAAAAGATLEAGLQSLRTAEDRGIGVIGWCFGGGWALQTAISTPDLDAAVVYYGKVETDPAVLAGLQAPLLGVFANQDDGIPVATVDAFEAALKEAGKDATVHRYDARHAFANPSNADYDEKKAGDAWAKVSAFLAVHLPR